MTSPADFRSRLAALLGPVHTADRAAEALGCTSRAVEYWFAGERADGRPVVIPKWAVRHVETVEMIIRSGDKCCLPGWWLTDEYARTIAAEQADWSASLD